MAQSTKTYKAKTFHHLGSNIKNVVRGLQIIHWDCVNNFRQVCPWDPGSPSVLTNHFRRACPCTNSAAFRVPGDPSLFHSKAFAGFFSDTKLKT